MDVIDIEEAWVEDGIVECGHSEWDIVNSVVQKEQIFADGSYERVWLG